MSHLCCSTSFLFKGISSYHSFKRTMDNQQLVLKHPEIEFRLKTINLFDKYGLNPTKEAFDVSRSSIYSWKNKLKSSNGRLFSLINRLRRPHNTRRMYIDVKIYNFIENLRKKYPRLSKDKIKPLLDEYCIENDVTSVSVSKIGKIINGIIHFFTYPKSPKMNAYIERFNRTIQEDFINHNQELMAYNLNEFNNQLMDYLLFYNTKRIHHSLNNIVPMDYILKNLHKSNMLWSLTSP